MRRSEVVANAQAERAGIRTRGQRVRAVHEAIGVVGGGLVLDVRVGSVHLGALAQVVVVAQDQLLSAGVSHVVPLAGPDVVGHHFRSAEGVLGSDAHRVAGAHQLVVVALVVGAELHGAHRVVAAQTGVPVVAQLGIAGTEGQVAAFPVGSDVVAVLGAHVHAEGVRASGTLVHADSGFGPETAQHGGTVGDLVGLPESHRGVQLVGEVARVVVGLVLNAIVGDGVVGLRRPGAEADHAETARQVHFALAAEELLCSCAGGAVETAFQLEASLQATAQVFHALETEAGRVVVHTGLRQITHLGMFDAGVDAAVQRHAALRKCGGAAQKGQGGESQTMGLLHVMSSDTCSEGGSRHRAGLWQQNASAATTQILDVTTSLAWLKVVLITKLTLNCHTLALFPHTWRTSGRKSRGFHTARPVHQKLCDLRLSQKHRI